MKICFITDNLVGYHKYWAGAEQACYRQAKLLIENGNNVIFLTQKPDIINPEEKLDVRSISIMGKGFLGRKLKSFLRRFLPFDPVSAISSYLVLKKIKPDVVHLHLFNELSLSLIWAAKRLRIPVVFSMYDYWIVCPKGTLINGLNEKCVALQGGNCDSCFWIDSKKMSAFRKIGLLKLAFKLRKRTLDYFLKRIDAFFVLSNSWVELLSEYGVNKNKIKIVPLPLPSSEENNLEENPIDEKMILFVGWVYPHKGLHILIKALSLVVKEVSDVKLCVVESGVDGDYKNSIIKDTEDLNIQKNVSFLGKLPNEKVRHLLQKAKIVVVPEQWGIAWPIFLTEAMLFKKLIVASRIGDIPEFIEDGKNGFLADPQNPNDFAGKIIRLLKENEFNDFGNNARAKILSFCDDNNILKKLESTYSSFKK